MIDKLFNSSRFFRKLVVWFYTKKEGGVFRSPSIRRLYERNREIKVGYASYGWTSDSIDGPATIGAYTSIGKNVRRICVNHLSSYATTHPCVFNPVFGWVRKDTRERTHIDIGNDVWIGDNVTILPSCTSIGNGAIIAAGAVVTKDIPPYQIWGGIPAHYIKRRLSEDIARRLEETEWWNLSEDKLKAYKDYFAQPEELIKALASDVK